MRESNPELHRLRAWHRPSKKMFYAGDDLERILSEPEIQHEDQLVLGLDGTPYLFNSDRTYLARTDTFILTQYTGLNDQSGQEIYEGDIVNLIPRGYASYPVEIRYDNTFACFGFWGVRADKDGKPCGFISIWDFLGRAKNFMGWEVIGNIYENPELLGAKDG